MLDQEFVKNMPKLGFGLMRLPRSDKAKDIIDKAIKENTSDEITEKLKKLIENIFKQFFKLIVIVHKSENGSVIIYSAEEHYLVDKRQCGKLVFAEIIFLSDYTE